MSTGFALPKIEAVVEVVEVVSLVCCSEAGGGLFSIGLVLGARLSFGRVRASAVISYIVQLSDYQQFLHKQCSMAFSNCATHRKQFLTKGRSV